MLKYSFLVIMSFLLIAITISCNKYLDAKSNKKLVLPTTLSNLQALLDNSSVMNERATSIDEAASDNYWVTDNYFNAASKAYRDIYSWQAEQADFPSYPDDWANLYNTVYYANVVLDNIGAVDRTTGNAQDFDNVLGSAMFYRASSFLKAAWIFAPAYDSTTADSDYGIVLRLFSDFNIPSKRSNIRETYQQIEKDITEAITLLPVVPASTMRPSKPAAYALMARMYLSMNNYKEAGLYADSCLQLYAVLMDYNDNPNAASTIPFQRFNKEVIFQQRIGLYSVSLISPANALTDTFLYNRYNENDLRKPLFFTVLNPGQYRFKGNYDGSAINLFTGIATDEVLLMRAECYARQNNMDAAVRDLNTLLKVRFKSDFFNPVTTSDVSDILKMILLERRKELLFRGLRWMDIKRLNKMGSDITLLRNIGNETFILMPNDKRYALPIPQTVIQESGIPQNDY